MTELREYEIIGVVQDNAWLIKNRDLLESHVRDDMRSHGVIPVLDVPITFTCSFDEEAEAFNFRLVSYGYRSKDAESYLGILIRDGIVLGIDGQKVILIEELQ